MFDYWNEKKVTWQATWLIHGSGKTWLPRLWCNDIHWRGDAQTRHALRYVCHGVPTFIRSRIGMSPEQLRLCLKCKNAVFSHDDDLDEHLKIVHYFGPESFIQTVFKRFRNIFL